VWQRSHQLALAIYRLTRSFPREERFTLVAQLRRAVISIGCNIAEGAKRRSDVDYARFVNMAEGSLAETESLLRLSRDLDFGERQVVDSSILECEEISRMLNAFREAIEENAACTPDVKRPRRPVDRARK
jgi:four helix bundle protein